MSPHPSLPSVSFISSSVIPVIVFSLLVFILKKRITDIQSTHISCKNSLHLSLLFLKSLKNNQPSLVKITHWNPKISHMVLGSKSTQDNVTKCEKMKESDERVKKRDHKRLLKRN